MKPLEQLTAFLLDVQHLEQMQARYPAGTPRGDAVAVALAAFREHFRTLDDFFGIGQPEEEKASSHRKKKGAAT